MLLVVQVYTFFAKKKKKIHASPLCIDHLCFIATNLQMSSVEGVIWLGLLLGESCV